jgi:4,5-epoxidase
VLLAGDAAHIHSPAGGQGMNTGMQDATNLAWKLALVVAGRASAELLDTYGQERLPVAQQVLGLTEAFVRFGTAPRSARRTLRDALLPALRLPLAQRRLARRLAETSVSYATSPLTRPGRVRGLPRSGERMPDLTVDSTEGPTTLYAALRHGRHVVLTRGVGTFDATTYDGLVDVVSASLPHGASALVRPDGYLAAVGTAFDTSEIHTYLHSVLATAPVRGSQPARV